jgi:hypothetical protein
MKKTTYIGLGISTLFIFLTSCASYSASPLNSLESDVVISQTPDSGLNDIAIGAKAFSKADCQRYLDRDVISKGYQPVQLYIQNSTNKNYVFSLNRISLSSARPEEVADKVHTNTAGRAAGYGAAAWFTFGLFAIPAVVDGIKSSNANEALDSDFSSKAARDQIIFHHSHFNKLLFVPVGDYQSTFTVTLVEQGSGTPKTFTVNTIN